MSNYGNISPRYTRSREAGYIRNSGPKFQLGSKDYKELCCEYFGYDSPHLAEIPRYLPLVYSHYHCCQTTRARICQPKPPLFLSGRYSGERNDTLPHQFRPTPNNAFHNRLCVPRVSTSRGRRTARALFYEASSSPLFWIDSLYP